MAIQANTVGGPLDDIYKDLKLLPTEVLKSYLQNPNNMQADGVSFSLMAGGVLADRARQQAAFAASQQPNPAQIPTVAQTLAQGQPVGVEGVPAGGAGITAFSTQAQQPQQQQQPQQITLNQPKQATPISLATPYAAAKTPLQQQASAPPTPTRKMAQGGIVAFSGEDGSYVTRSGRSASNPFSDTSLLAEFLRGRAEREKPEPALYDPTYPEPRIIRDRFESPPQIAPQATRSTENVNQTQQEFISKIMPMATQAAEKLNVPVEAVIAQWALETGWGKSTIPGSFNLGNIKAEPGYAGRTVSAVDNQTKSKDPYRAYASFEEGAEDFTKLLEGKRYAGVKGTTTPKDYFSALKTAGYAEDPNYVTKGADTASAVTRALAAQGIQGGAGTRSGVASLLQGPPRSAAVATPTATAATPSTPTTPEAAPGLPSLRETPEMKEAFANIGTMPSFSAADAEKARKEAVERFRGAVDPRMAEIQKLYAAQSGIAGKGQENFMPLMVAGLGAQLAQMSAPKGTLAHGLGAVVGSGIGAYRTNQQEQIARELEANKLQIKLQEQLMKQGLDEVTAGNVAEKEARKIVEDTAEARSKMGGRQAQAISSSTTAQASLERAQNQLITAQNNLKYLIDKQADNRTLAEAKFALQQAVQAYNQLKGSVLSPKDRLALEKEMRDEWPTVAKDYYAQLPNGAQIVADLTAGRVKENDLPAELRNRAKELFRESLISGTMPAGAFVPTRDEALKNLRGG